MLLRWGGCSQWAAKKRENQENSEILNHGGESWTRTQRFLKSVLRAHHFIANILSKSSVPVYCLFVFACFFFLLWQFFCIFLFSVYSSLLQGTETGSKDEHSKNKLQNTNFTKATKFYACWLCVSNGTRSLSFLVCQKAKNITLHSIQVGYVKSQKVAAPLSSN